MDMNNVKWAEANAEIGLKHNEICQGLTVDQHAESLAMFMQHDVDGNNAAWSLALKVVAAKIKSALMGGYEADQGLTEPS